MSRQSILIAVFMLGFFPATAFAQSGTSEDRRACNGDARRFCSRVIKDGEMVVYSCLQQNVNRLTKRCRKVIVGY